jgi:hypothetical protein
VGKIQAENLKEIKKTMWRRKKQWEENMREKKGGSTIALDRKMNKQTIAHPYNTVSFLNKKK